MDARPRLHHRFRRDEVLLDLDREFDVLVARCPLPGAWHRSATQPGARGIVDGKR